MSDPTGEREVPHGVFLAAAALAFAAGIAIAYRSEHAYRRWWKANHPWRGAKEGMARANEGYRRRRGNATETAEVLGGLVAEVAHALNEAQRRRA
ncbi:MAG TPA: hypothetical protein VK646_05240 [Actinomycetota bacterium]|nr:hypothetical protein [Actinomycetota bacterium]